MFSIDIRNIGEETDRGQGGMRIDQRSWWLGGFDCYGD